MLPSDRERKRMSPSPFMYLLAQLSMLIFPTARAYLYIQDIDAWRAERIRGLKGDGI